MAAIGFAFFVFFWPRLTVPGLTLLWGGYSFVDGILALAIAWGGNSGRPRVWLSLVGMAGISCAGAVLIAPQEVAQHLVEIIATWAILTGAMQVWIALKLGQAVDGEWVLTLDGLGAMVFGVALSIWPHLEVPALVWLVGWFAALLGSLFLGIGLWLGKSAAR
jgi:uncharacterized membrane protein HdeD (DUF308 family)